MKTFFRRIHLYLGLGAGIIIMITCLTGAILVYEKELQQLFNNDRYYTENTGSRLSTDSLIAKLKISQPGAKISSVKVYTEEGRNTEIGFAPKEKKGEGKEKGKNAGRLVAFMNPYTGEVAEVYNHRESFFYWVMDVHRWMLGGDVGKMVVGIATIIFLFIIITGIVLWWPRNKAILKQRLRLKMDGGFKRANHDFHVVLGFYSSIFLFILAFTGLAWSFTWFNEGIYKITNSSMERAKPLQSVIQETGKASVESALMVVATAVESPYYSITLPKDSTDAYAINILPKGSAHESATDTYFVDRYSGKLAGIQKFTDRNLGQRVRATFKPVHVASIYGHTSKIIGVIVCLLGTFFPASGIIMWINRTRKKRKKI